MKKCSTCGEYIFSYQKHHRCPPIWQVRIVESDPHYWGDDPKKLRAHDAEQAATLFAEWWDATTVDYICIGGEPITVDVWPDGKHDDKNTFTVTGEMVPYYSAEQEETGCPTD